MTDSSGSTTPPIPTRPAPSLPIADLELQQRVEGGVTSSCDTDTSLSSNTNCEKEPATTDVNNSSTVENTCATPAAPEIQTLSIPIAVEQATFTPVQESTSTPAEPQNTAQNSPVPPTPQRLPPSAPQRKPPPQLLPQPTLPQRPPPSVVLLVKPITPTPNAPCAPSTPAPTLGILLLVCP